jgi:hypothetical protein
VRVSRLTFATDNNFPKFNFRYVGAYLASDAFQHPCFELKSSRVEQMNKAFAGLAWVFALVGGVYFAASKWMFDMRR